MSKKVLVTGGAGYIGSTVAWALRDAGHAPVILDSLVNGSAEMVADMPLYRVDIADRAALADVFGDHPDISCAIHCAALARVPDSVRRPYEYYANNVSGSLELFAALAELGCRDIVFSSSGSVYRAADGGAATEESPVAPASPYSRTKLMTEMTLEDMSPALGLRSLALRYFNPIGADPKGRCGQPRSEASQILAILLEVARGERGEFSVTGTDWPTRDGTGIRDYVHVWDLARAHVMAVEEMDAVFPDGAGFEIINLGAGAGVTVRELVSAFERALGKPIPQRDAPPRPGDVAGAYADPSKALKLLGWQPTLTLEDAFADAMRWAGVARESR